MSLNPRKFSEKIALQQKKQAEGTAAYENIIREVCAATKVRIKAINIIEIIQTSFTMKISICFCIYSFESMIQFMP